ncbi:hypothetical protein [Ramlibacter algicola]|uniref:hypothetical protein n=1 Tax=Ramlibacter algicola TaxID=2795217 RepID=UPI0030842720
MRLSLTTTTALALLLAAPAFAQTTPKAPGKPAAKAPAAKAKPKLARSAQKAVEEVTPIDDDPNVKLTDDDLEVAKRVDTGELPCELGATVNVKPARRAGLFVVTTKGYRFLMHPVESRTGAIRLEDPKRGAMWLQLGNKSMLMSQKLGQRLADECQSPKQKDMAEDLKRNPRPSILDAPQPAASASRESLPPGTPASAAQGLNLPPAPQTVPASAPTPAPTSAPAASPASAPAQ